METHLDVEEIPARGTPAGVIVLLHGWGANAADLIGLAPALNLPTYQFLAPNAPLDHPQVYGGKMWYDIQTQVGLETSRELLGQWLQELESKTQIPLSKTFLAGFSQGGAMTLDLGLGLPLAGLLVFSGYLHFNPTPSDRPRPPVLLVHGRQDPVVPLALAHQARDRLTSVGVDLDYYEFDMGHEIQPVVIDRAREFVVAH